MEKAMAPHSSTLAWQIPWMEEPGRLQSMGLLGIGHDWATSLSLFTFMHWRRKWQPTPVFLPGISQRQGSLVGRHDWSNLAAVAARLWEKQVWKNLAIFINYIICSLMDRFSLNDSGDFYLFIFFSSTSLLLPTHLPSPSSGMHTQSCNPMDCSPPGSSVPGLFQARILE